MRPALPSTCEFKSLFLSFSPFFVDLLFIEEFILFYTCLGFFSICTLFHSLSFVRSSAVCPLSSISTYSPVSSTLSSSFHSLPPIHHPTYHLSFSRAPLFPRFCLVFYHTPLPSNPFHISFIPLPPFPHLFLLIPSSFLSGSSFYNPNHGFSDPLISWIEGVWLY